MKKWMIALLLFAGQAQAQVIQNEVSGKKVTAKERFSLRNVNLDTVKKSSDILTYSDAAAPTTAWVKKKVDSSKTTIGVLFPLKYDSINKILSADTTDACDTCLATQYDLSQISGGGGSETDPESWHKTGNAGTTPGTQFIGTTDGVGLRFKINNSPAGYIDYDYGNTSFGYLSSRIITTGTNNVSLGGASLYSNITGTSNIAIGVNSLFFNTANENVAIGIGSGQTLTTGSKNTLIGSGTLTSANNTSNAIALGYEAVASSNQFALDNSIYRWKSQGLSRGGTTVNYVLTDSSGNGDLVLKPAGGGGSDGNGIYSADGTATSRTVTTSSFLKFRDNLKNTGLDIMDDGTILIGDIENGLSGAKVIVDGNGGGTTTVTGGLDISGNTIFRSNGTAAIGSVATATDVIGNWTWQAPSVAVNSITGLGTGVGTWLATPSSSNLRTALTDETGTGSAVFATSPTLVTPTLGVATATSLGIGATATSKIHIQTNAIGVTQSDANGLLLENTTAATLGNQQYSPPIVLHGRGWSTTSSASQNSDIRIMNTPIQSTTSVLSRLVVERNNNSTGYSELFSIGQVSGSSSNTLSINSLPVLGVGGGVTQLYGGSSGYQLYNSAGSVAWLGINNLGKITLLNTVTTAGTTGDRTINQPSGTVNMAAGGTTLTVTNSTVTTSSLVFATVRTNDATAIIKNVVPGSGSFVITLSAAATAETSIGFFVIN